MRIMGTQTIWINLFTLDMQNQYVHDFICPSQLRSSLHYYDGMSRTEPVSVARSRLIAVETHEQKLFLEVERHACRLLIDSM